MAQDELIALAQKKLQELQTAFILETDTAVKFKLQHEIQALKAQIQVLGGNPDGLLNENMHNQIDNNQIIGNNNKIQVIIYSWRWWGLGVVGVLVFIFVLGKFSSNSQIVNGNCNTVVASGSPASASVNCTSK
ncbi:MAG: hypothetical protein PHP00_08780 [Thiotrichaceae bacterium]|nr:hypothetical protein [Thiotrichaceae bacterium]